MSKERGMIDYLSAFTLIIISIIVFAYMDSTQTQSNSLDVYENSIKAKYNAESGIEHYLSLLSLYGIDSDKYNEEVYSESLEYENGKEIFGLLNNGTYKTTLVELNSTKNEFNQVIEREVILYSYGYCDNIQSYIEASISISVNSGTFNYNVLKWKQEK